MELGSLEPVDGRPGASGGRPGAIAQDRAHRGCIPFTAARSPISGNRFYIASRLKGEVLPGEQPAILVRDLFDAVQAKLSDQRNINTVTRGKSESQLIGRL